MYHLANILQYLFWQIPKSIEVVKLYVEINVMGHINLKTKENSFRHILININITVKHKITFLIILSKNVTCNIFGDSFSSFLCMTVINMAVLICHSTMGWNPLKLLHHSEAWRRETESIDLIWIFVFLTYFVLQITFPVFPSSSPLWTIAPQGFFLSSLLIAMLV